MNGQYVGRIQDVFASTLHTSMSYDDFCELEIEIRIGTFDSNAGRYGKKPAFVPGVASKVFESVKGILASSRSFSSTPDSLSSIRLYDNKYRIESSNGENVLTRKILVTNLDVVTSPNHYYDIRVSIARELPVNDAKLLKQMDSMQSLHTRKRVRQTFTYKMWRIDMTRVTKELNVEQKDDDMKYTYEIEIELCSSYYDKETYRKMMDPAYQRYVILCGLHLVCDIIDMSDRSSSMKV